MNKIVEKNTKWIENSKTHKLVKYIDYDFFYDVVKKWYCDDNNNLKSDNFYFPVLDKLSVLQKEDDIALVSSYIFSTKKDLQEELDWINNNEKKAIQKYSKRNETLSDEENLKKVKKEIENEIKIRENKSDVISFKNFCISSNFFSLETNDLQNPKFMKSMLRLSLLKDCNVNFDYSTRDTFYFYKRINIKLSEFNNVLISSFNNSKYSKNYMSGIYFYLNNFVAEKQNIIVEKNNFNYREANQFQNVKINNLTLNNFKPDFENEYIIAKKLEVNTIEFGDDFLNNVHIEETFKNIDFNDIKGVQNVLKNLDCSKSKNKVFLFQKLNKINRMPDSFKINLREETLSDFSTLWMGNLDTILGACKDTLDLSESSLIKCLSFDDYGIWGQSFFKTKKIIFPKKIKEIEGQIYPGSFVNIKFWENIGFTSDNFKLFFGRNWRLDEDKQIEIYSFDSSKKFEVLNDAGIFLKDNGEWENKKIRLTIKIDYMESKTLNPIYNITKNMDLFRAENYMDTLDINTFNFELTEKSLMGFKTIRCLKDDFEIFKEKNMEKTTNNNGEEVWYFKNHADYFNVPVNTYPNMEYNKLSFIFECNNGTYTLIPDKVPYFYDGNYLTYNITKIK
ncbi:Hypothetical Protein MfeM64YM_0871 [Mycoplasmopsis fermentans M64]|uniref:Uncharacterized protein n=1 Tax=Mycoplasmopsis fermentans (strain M64) TaxID=943945 RepID=A0AB32XD08_MYCFM|nr:Hypothetical Protein MfeM64YM_0871 [Mycoplasmopsis fermentans M64]